MDKKYQIFISSTYKDLKKARLIVRDAILSIYHFPVGMEMFGAADEEQWEIIKNDIDNSDYYVLIIGKCFGSEVPGEGISYTQKEFRYAVKKGIPVLAFIMKDDAKVANTFKENNKDKIKKLEEFKNEVKENRTVDWWSKPEELSGKVISALTRQIARKPRAGWIRVTDFDIEKNHAEMLELSRKVRLLEEENKDLQAIIGEKSKPNIVVDAFKPIIIKKTCVDAVPDLNEWYKKLKNSDATGLGVTPQSVNRYNHNLPSDKEIQELSNSINIRNRILSGYAWLDLVISNQGSSMATYITIEIVDIPDGIEIYENDDINMLTEITLPKHKIGGKATVLPGINPRQVREEYEEKLISLDKIDGWEIIDNIPLIVINELRHKSSKRSTEFFIVGNKKGNYQLKCRIMCAEYKDSVEQMIEVMVE